MMMDIRMTSFYEDTAGHMHGHGTIMKPRKPSPSMNEMKRSMKLELNSGSDSALCQQPASKKMRTGNTPQMLSSPDLKMLKLASPDLEKFFLTNLTGTTTPTPTQYFFPKNVSEEQDSFAKGFVAALSELRQNDPSQIQQIELTAAVPPVGATATVGTTIQVDKSGRSVQLVAAPLMNTNSAVLKVEPPLLQQGEPKVLTVLNPVTTGSALFIPATSTSSHNTSSTRLLPQTLNSPPPHLGTMINPNLMHIKEESEMVPSPAMTSDSMRSSVCGTPPPSESPLDISPIDMEMQEKVKIERKRARNRIAAMKCRQRKLERIQVLEERVSELKHNNQDLQVTAEKLRQQVMQLKDQIMQHVNAGCQIVPPNSLAQ